MNLSEPKCGQMTISQFPRHFMFHFSLVRAGGREGAVEFLGAGAEPRPASAA